MGNKINETDYFYSLEEAMKKYKAVVCVFYDRVSTNSQDERDNAEIRKSIIYDKCKELGIEIIAYFYEVAPGWSNRIYKRVELPKAIEMAIKSNAMLLVPSVDRLIRSSSNTNDTFTLLNKNDIKFLEKRLGKIKGVVSVIPPGTLPGKVRGIFTKWGQEGRENKGGRRKKTKRGALAERRRDFTPLVIQLDRKKFSRRNISEYLLENYGEDISYRIIHDWIKKAGE